MYDNELLTPDGNSALKIDRIMVLAMWAKYLDIENKKKTSQKKQDIIFSGIGKPTYPLNDFAVKFSITYWNTLLNNSQDARQIINNTDYFKTSKARDEITEIDGVIGYGDPSGDLEYRKLMAEALTKWYGKEVGITDKNILFTVGGAAALHIVFGVLNKQYPNGRIITQFPYYSLYSGFDNSNKLHPIPVMDKSGYRLSAEALEESIIEANALAKEDGSEISAFLLCDPNNPLGTSLNKKELKDIAEVLKKYPKILIILDEAYAEMRFNGIKISLLNIAPELKKRIVLLRSGTKALSSAGERMGIMVAFDANIMNKFLEFSIGIYGHAPRSSQGAFATAMNRLDLIELSNLKSFYEPQTKLITEALSSISAKLPDQNYKVDGTFYVACDLSDLFGLELPEELNKVFKNRRGKTIETDEDIAYYLLFKDGVMITPLSYFGIDGKSGYMRITCSSGDTLLNSLINKIEYRLIEGRKLKKSNLEMDLSNNIKALFHPIMKNNELIRKVEFTLEKGQKKDMSAKELSEHNNTLHKLLETTNKLLMEKKSKTDNLKFFQPEKNNLKKQEDQKNNEQKLIQSKM
jgi:aspartate/methionine/tyrosine aminotransferase